MPEEKRAVLPLKGIRINPNPEHPTLAILHLKTEDQDFFCLATKHMLEALARECLAAAIEIEAGGSQ